MTLALSRTPQIHQSHHLHLPHHFLNRCLNLHLYLNRRLNLHLYLNRCLNLNLHLNLHQWRLISHLHLVLHLVEQSFLRQSWQQSWMPWPRAKATLRARVLVVEEAILEAWARVLEAWARVLVVEEASPLQWSSQSASFALTLHGK